MKKLTLCLIVTIIYASVVKCEDDPAQKTQQSVAPTPQDEALSNLENQERDTRSAKGKGGKEIPETDGRALIRTDENGPSLLFDQTDVEKVETYFPKLHSKGNRSKRRRRLRIKKRKSRPRYHKRDRDERRRKHHRD